MAITTVNEVFRHGFGRNFLVKDNIDSRAKQIYFNVTFAAGDTYGGNGGEARTITLDKYFARLLSVEILESGQRTQHAYILRRGVDSDGDESDAAGTDTDTNVGNGRLYIFEFAPSTAANAANTGNSELAGSADISGYSYLIRAIGY